MFEAGETNEDSLERVLRASWGDNIMTQEECAIKWEVSHGDVSVPVTGRPDIVLADENGVPIHGTEQKLTCSYWSARDTGPFSKRAPKMAHLAQAAHYMWKLGEAHGKEYIPWDLQYTSRMNWVTFGYKDYPEEHPAVTRKADGKPYRLTPYYSIYNLKMIGGVLYFKHENDRDWTRTKISTQGIEDFYTLLAECIATETLPPRMTELTVTGEIKDFQYQPQYNPFAELHDAVDRGELDFRGFIEGAKAIEDGGI